MKTLSLKQPFAELVVSGKKTVELRKWNTKFRGEFLIHASLTPHSESMKRFGYSELPLGYIIGKAKLVDVKEYSSDEEFWKDRKKHLASKEFGRYGFILKDAERLPLKECKGKLGFWESI
jgi:predicted transcriptional regulator